MTEDMRYLKHLASSKLSSFKSYLDARNPTTGDSTDESSTRKSWTRWAGDKLKGRSQDSNGFAVEKISLFPGWAARRFQQSPSNIAVAQFDIELFVSGYASRINNPEFMSRSQKAFLRLAKGFASLPKLHANSMNVSDSPNHLEKSTEDSLASVHLPPSPSEMTEDAEVQALEEQFRKSMDPNSQNTTDDEPQIQSASPISSSMQESATLQSTIMNNLHELHANLEARLQPFWSSSLPNRTVRISLYTSEEDMSIASALSGDEDYGDPNLQPILVREVTTAKDGLFQTNFGISWDSLCTHPTGLKIAFGDMKEEHSLYVLAELLSPPPAPSTPLGYRQYRSPSRTSLEKSTAVFVTNIKTPLTSAPVRVISDIDDTIKKSNILSGARIAFNTVFVQRLENVIIPGIAEWYADMWERGVRYHYVSNAPFQMLPVLDEFFQLAKLPHGSVRLCSYGGKSFFDGLLTAPATRKRQGVLDLLITFPESQFMLVGDSGEQDLELYASLAIARPQQILAIFVRDVRPQIDGEEPKPLDDPTGSRALLRKWSASAPMTPAYPLQRPEMKRATSEIPISRPKAIQLASRSSNSVEVGATDYMKARPYLPSKDSSAWIPGEMVEEPLSSPGGGHRKISDMEGKRFELQTRVDQTRMKVPYHIPIRIFRQPEECVEWKEILDKIYGGLGGSEFTPQGTYESNVLIEI